MSAKKIRRPATYSQLIANAMKQPTLHKPRIAACPPKRELKFVGGPFDGRWLRVAFETLKPGGPVTLPILMRDGRRGRYILTTENLPGLSVGTREIARWEPSA